MAKISPHQWQEVSPLLDQALSLSGNEREAWLQSLTTSSPESKKLLRLLLQEHRALIDEHFLEFSPGPPGAGEFLQGQSVGPYTLISPIGSGGMGRVWLAERSDGRFNRRVAVKFLQFSVATRAGAERFKREGRILGSLAHPNIAELIDAGVMPDGQPYMVIEYVEGEPIDQYCDAHALDVNARIRLFLDVLSALNHAHANLIVHRDLKPSNVLVSAQGQVKLLDFGIAKLLAHDAESPATLLTIDGAAALTPYFAAPEQVTGGAVTTATDIYAVGVLLYLLLSGQHPLGQASSSTADLIKGIVDIEPPRPSDANSSAKLALEAAHGEAAKRGCSPAQLRRQLCGDLDTIVMRALKKSPSERYSSVTALADDLRRYLNHAPISARPDTVAYRAAKFVRRNRLAVALTTVAIVALVAGLFGTLLQARTARLQRDAALRERDRANRIADFMTGIFKVSDPGERVGNTVTARDLLDKGSKEVETSLAKDPALQAQMLHVMGKAYMMLGLDYRAETLFEHSVKLADSAIGPDSPETLSTANDLSWTLFQQGRLAEAETLQRKLLDQERRVLGPDSKETLGTMDQLATSLWGEGKNAEAIKLDRETLERDRRVSGEQAFSTLATMDNLSIILASDGQLAEAEKLEQKTLDIQIRVNGFENLGTISSMINLASIQRDMGKYDQAEKLFHQALDLEARVLGPDQPETAETKYDLAALLVRRGKTDKAFSLIREAIDHGLHARIDLAIAKDPNLEPLHTDPRFAALLAHAKKQAAMHSLN